jgi:single-stranded DNA-binding protein
VKQDGGTVDKVDIWGRRRLSYEIDKKPEGIYAVIDVTCQPAAVQELDRQLNLNEAVLRTKVYRRGSLTSTHVRAALAWRPQSAPDSFPASERTRKVRLTRRTHRDAQPHFHSRRFTWPRATSTSRSSATSPTIPRLRFTPSGAAVAILHGASNSRYLDKTTNEWKDGEARLHAVLGVASVRRERRRVAHPRHTRHRHRPPQAAPYDNRDGQKVTVMEMEVDDVGPALRTRDRRRSPRSPAPAAASVATAAAASAAAAVPAAATIRGANQSGGGASQGGGAWSGGSASYDEPPF